MGSLEYFLSEVATVIDNKNDSLLQDLVDQWNKASSIPEKFDIAAKLKDELDRQDISNIPDEEEGIIAILEGRKRRGKY